MTEHYVDTSSFDEEWQFSTPFGDFRVNSDAQVFQLNKAEDAYYFIGYLDIRLFERKKWPSCKKLADNIAKLLQENEV